MPEIKPEKKSLLGHKYDIALNILQNYLHDAIIAFKMQDITYRRESIALEKMKISMDKSENRILSIYSALVCLVPDLSDKTYEEVDEYLTKMLYPEQEEGNAE